MLYSCGKVLNTLVSVKEKMVPKLPNKYAFLTWLLYPYTVVEATVMLVANFVFSIVLRLYYCDLWYPSDRRSTKKYSLREESMNASDALAVMKHLDQLSEDHGVRGFWLSGTLLGLVRQNRPLNHDHDLDYGIFSNEPRLPEFIKSVANLCGKAKPFREQKLTLKCTIQNPDLQHLPQRRMRYVAHIRLPNCPDMKRVKVDLFLHFPYRGGNIHGSRNSIWWNSNFEVMKRQFGQQSFLVPADSHQHLLENYGDYSKEVRDFENSIDCPNAMNIYSWASLVYLWQRKKLLVKLQNWQKVRRINNRIVNTILKGLKPY